VQVRYLIALIGLLDRWVRREDRRYAEA